MPAATVAIFCSATPISMNREGNSLWNHSARVDSSRSAERTTTRSSAFPASTTPFPNPSRVAACSGLLKIFAASFASELSILLMFTLDLPAKCAEFVEEFLRLFLRGGLAVPFVVEFHILHPFAGNGMCDDDGRFRSEEHTSEL